MIDDMRRCDAVIIAPFRDVPLVLVAAGGVMSALADGGGPSKMLLDVGSRNREGGKHGTYRNANRMRCRSPYAVICVACVASGRARLWRGKRDRNSVRASGVTGILRRLKHVSSHTDDD